MTPPLQPGDLEPEPEVRAASPDSLLDLCADLREIARDLAAIGSAASTLGLEVRTAEAVEPLLAAARAEADRLNASVSDAQRAQIERLGLEGPLKLNLGAGTEGIDGWVDVDLFGGDVVADLRRPLPFETGSASHVYAAHVLEHLRHPDEAWALLRECRRVLRRGGRLRVVVPDIEAYVDAYRSVDDAAWSALAEVRGWDTSASRLDGVLRYAGASHHPAGFFGHQHGYDRASLAELVASVGFGPIRFCGHQGSSDEVLRVDDRSGAAGVTHDGRPLSLFLEAYALF